MILDYSIYFDLCLSHISDNQSLSLVASIQKWITNLPGGAKWVYCGEYMKLRAYSCIIIYYYIISLKNYCKPTYIPQI